MLEQDVKLERLLVYAAMAALALYEQKFGLRLKISLKQSFDRNLA